MKRCYLLSAIVLAALFFAACSQAIAPTEVKSPAPVAGTTRTTAEWEQRWDTVLAAAKKEGTVNIYTTWAGASRVAQIDGFKKKYGIDAEFTSFGRGAEFIVRAQAERTAGIKTADVYGFGSSTLLVLAKPDGLLGPIEPFLILPEVVDAKLWRGGVMPFLDKDKRAIGMSGNVMPYVAVNTEMVNARDITSYKDLLKPQYKGKITVNDPTITGAGSGFLAHLAYHIWSEDESFEFIRQLIKNEAVVMRDQRLQAEWLARGKNPIALALDPNGFAELLDAGAPITRASMKEGVLMATGDGSVGLPAVVSHPNAATVFLNWLLSKEGQTIYAKGAGAISKRLDVSTEGYNANLVPGPQEKLFVDTEDFIINRGKLVEIAKKALAADIK